MCVCVRARAHVSVCVRARVLVCALVRAHVSVCARARLNARAQADRSSGGAGGARRPPRVAVHRRLCERQLAADQ